ncbi:hypothetical protein Taro_020360 [Colocasia esculenta]|uniref:Uncharacterized protein n=1 Tax=Colocasia esculenta TaxID=4460 RepID=A0A843UNH4_COLES|nr:hypothetical protein [Colocasia esculenta]
MFPHSEATRDLHLSPMAGIYRAGVATRSLGRLLDASRARSFGASAAVWLEYESDEEWEVGGRGKVDACGEMEGRGVQWVFMGSPSAQKHVYDTRIAALLGVPYISMGDLVLQKLHHRSSIYKKITICFPTQPSDHVANSPKLPCA